jgi:hypothetical protein
VQREGGQPPIRHQFPEPRSQIPSSSLIGPQSWIQLKERPLLTGIYKEERTDRGRRTKKAPDPNRTTFAIWFLRSADLSTTPPHLEDCSASSCPGHDSRGISVRRQRAARWSRSYGSTVLPFISKSQRDVPMLQGSRRVSC